MSRKCALLIVVASFLFVAGCKSKARLPELTTAQLSEKHIDALGGPAALKQLQSWSIRSRVNGDKQTLGFINTAIRLPNHILVSSHLGKSTTILMFDGQNGWTRDAGGVASMDEKEIARLRVRSYLDEFLACQPEYCNMAVTGQEAVDSVPCYVLKLTWKDGYQTTVYLRSTDFLIAKVGSSIEHKRRSIPLDTFFTDYRHIGGVLVPFELRVAGPYGSYTISVESFEPNIELADSRFSVEKMKEE